MPTKLIGGILFYFSSLSYNLLLPILYIAQSRIDSTKYPRLPDGYTPVEQYDSGFNSNFHHLFQIADFAHRLVVHEIINLYELSCI